MSVVGVNAPGVAPVGQRRPAAGYSRKGCAGTVLFLASVFDAAAVGALTLDGTGLPAIGVGRR